MENQEQDTQLTTQSQKNFVDPVSTNAMFWLGDIVLKSLLSFIAMETISAAWQRIQKRWSKNGADQSVSDKTEETNN